MADAAELGRLAALRQLSILDTPNEPLFDSFVSLIAESFDVPVALISLVDEDRQWFKAVVGLSIDQTARAVAFCDHTIRSTDVMAVLDTTLDERFRDNPLVTGPPYIRFYAGAPLVAPEGYRVGTLSLIAFEPREHFRGAEAARLKALADSIMQTLIQRARALQTEQFATIAAERLQLLTMAEQMSGVGSWSWDAATGQVRWSDECRRIHRRAGPPPASTDYRSMFAAYHPQDRAALIAAIEGAVERVHEFEVSVRLLERAGSVRQLLLRGAARLGEDRQLLGLYGTVQDLTEAMRAQEALKTSEAALRVSEQRLQAVLENATVAIFLLDEAQRCIFINAAAELLTGCELPELVNHELGDLLEPRQSDGSAYGEAERPFARALRQDRRMQGEGIVTHKSGRQIPVAFTASPVRDQAGAVTGIVVEATDISERRRQEAVQELLMREVDHRARNALSVVQSIVQLTRAADVATFKEVVLGRVSALARAQGSLTQRRWQSGSAKSIVEDELAIVAKPEQVQVEGDDMAVAARDVQPLAMIVHELATNAVKHGALSAAAGCVHVSLTARSGLEIVWRESRGPRVTTPARRGFGSRMIYELSAQLGAHVEMNWLETGLEARLVLPPTRDEDTMDAFPLPAGAASSPRGQTKQ